MRILRDPAPDASGGGNPATPPPAPTQNVLGQPPAPPPTIQLTVDEYQRLRESERTLSTVQAEKQAEIDRKERERIKALADKGEVEKALTTQEESYKGKLTEAEKRYGTLEQRYLGKEKSLVVATGMAGLEFASDFARADMQRSLEQDFVSRLDSNGEPAVVDPVSGRPALDVIRERIKSGRYDHCLKPSNRGGTPPGSGHKPPPGEQSAPTDPAERMFESIREQQMSGQIGHAVGLAGQWGRSSNN